MKLESLRLVNIRAFEDSGEIQFQNGTISIYGENGAGKSNHRDEHWQDDFWLGRRC